MPLELPFDELQAPLRHIVGYLNFSDGTSDLGMLSSFNKLYGKVTGGRPLSGAAPWQTIREWLQQSVDRLEGTSPAFSDLSRARQVIQLQWTHLLPAYIDFHRDLLFHQRPESLLNGFFLGRCAEALLVCGGLDLPLDQVIQATIVKLNDFVGYRPVAVLEGRRLEPYSHEWVRPIPLFIQGAGIAEGPYQQLIEKMLEVLRATDADLLRQAHMDPEAISELSLDPRAYDFEHPVAHRPNHQFGQWDPHLIDGQGRYRRFVLQQVTTDALLQWVANEQNLSRQEALWEAAVVLCGTTLMASGLCGWGPNAHPSTVTLSSLLGVIASYRDDFYRRALAALPKGPISDRLHEEAEQLRQPFGGARQHLNAAIAAKRADQLQRVHLARLYARMGYPESARLQADYVAAPSARMICRIDCALTHGKRAIRQKKLQEAAAIPGLVEDYIQRGIQCGALVDPWNILGFAGNFSRFPSPDAAIHDHRVDDLVVLIERTLGYTAQVWSEAAARDDGEVYSQMERQFKEIAIWWRQFAAHQIEQLQAVDPLDSYESAQLVARALRLWHRGGAAAGDIAFWAPHAELFDSPRAYALVIEALLQRGDFVASMALLVHWLSAAERIGLRRGDSSFPTLAERWLSRVRERAEARSGAVEESWSLARKFFDYLEANAEQLWETPDFALAKHRPEPPKREPGDRESTARDDDESQLDDEDETRKLFDAAYEGVTYRDSTDDGVEGSVFGGDEGATDADSSEDELQAECRRLNEHLDFLASLARMWAVASDVALRQDEGTSPEKAATIWQQRRDVMQAWAAVAAENRRGLLRLITDVMHYRIPGGGAGGESMTRYDRQRMLRDSLLERAISTAVEVSDARRVLLGVLASRAEPGQAVETDEGLGDDDRHFVTLTAAILAGDSPRVRQQFGGLLASLRDKNLLYIPLARGGDPAKIFAVRLRQRVLTRLAHWLPRRGHFRETFLLVEHARDMESRNPVGPGAITEFHSLYQVAFKSLVDSLIDNAVTWQGRSRGEPRSLVPLLEKLTEVAMTSWLSHSQTLRLSALETVNSRDAWNQLTEFIKQYGHPIFTQTFLRLRTIRAILHQGVGSWLKRLEEENSDLADTPLVHDLGNRLDPKVAERALTTVFETIMDHHAEYLDYNSTTTQSDRGDLLFMFFEFLRLKVRYDRIAWNLKPVMWAHDLLLRRGLEKAAQQWRRSLADKIADESETFISELKRLQRKYAIRMPTVADRIHERFIQQMTVDRMRALVEPAIEDAELGQPSPSFEMLSEEVENLTKVPTGVGLDLPPWLAGLDDEVSEQLQHGDAHRWDPLHVLTIPLTSLTVEELRGQLEAAHLQHRLPFTK